MTEFVTTLSRIREHLPCVNGWKRMLESLGKTTADDEPLPFRVILESNGLDDALWCCRTAPEYAREWRLYAVWCARQVQHLMTDAACIHALDVAESYANGEATEEELAASRAAARKAIRKGARTGDAAEAVTRGAVRTATRDAAWAAARDIAWTAAREAARAAAREETGTWTASQDAAWDAASEAALARAWGVPKVNAAWVAVWDSAWTAARAAQKEEFLRVISGKGQRNERTAAHATVM
jgi:hypothetical protein